MPVAIGTDALESIYSKYLHCSALSSVCIQLRQLCLTDLVEQNAGSRCNGVVGAHALQMEQQGLAEVVQTGGARVEQLVVDHPCCEVIGPLSLAESKVQSTCVQ